MKTLNLKSGTVIKAAAFAGNKQANWSPSGQHYQILVDYFITPGNKKSFRFDFWDSIHNKQNGIACDIRGALACWAFDALVGINASSVDDIASDFGYTVPSEAIRVYRGVKHAETQFKRIGMTEEDLQELADY